MNWREISLTVVLSSVTTLAVDRGLAHLIGKAVASTTQEPTELVVDRLVVRKELVVSDTQLPWEKGFEKQQIPRGIVARSLAADRPGETGVAGLWVRSRILKGEIDDPFDDRFHAINRDGTPFKAPGHLSWNIWLDGAWRQMALLQGEALENNEVPYTQLAGGNHPGRLRFQSFRPNHSEPLTDAVLGQGKLSIGGGGFGGGGLPYPQEVLEIRGGKVVEHPLEKANKPQVLEETGAGRHSYRIIPVGPQGKRGPASEEVFTRGRATLAWDSVNGADAYIVVRDGQEITAPIRLEGSRKTWKDQP